MELYGKAGSPALGGKMAEKSDKKDNRVGAGDDDSKTHDSSNVTDEDLEILEMTERTLVVPTPRDEETIDLNELVDDDEDELDADDLAREADDADAKTEQIKDEEVLDLTDEREEKEDVLDLTQEA